MKTTKELFHEFEKHHVVSFNSAIDSNDEIKYINERIRYYELLNETGIDEVYIKKFNILIKKFNILIKKYKKTLVALKDKFPEYNI